MSKMIDVTCPKCKQVRQMRLTNYIRGGKTGLCLKCHNLRGSRQTGATLIHDGYVLVSQANHPRALYRGFVKRAVLVLEEHLSRHLTSQEHIHHINGIRDDDRLENLIILTNSEHAHLHMKVKPNIKNRYQMALTQR